MCAYVLTRIPSLCQIRLATDSAPCGFGFHASTACGCSWMLILITSSGAMQNLGHPSAVPDLSGHVLVPRKEACKGTGGHCLPLRTLSTGLAGRLRFKLYEIVPCL